MAEEKRKRILSGIQPTGTPTLGNYIGAVRNWALLQSDYDCLYMVADLHSLTVRQNPAELRRRTRELLEKGQKASYEQVLKDVQQRDYQDTHRDIAPLKMCRDSVKVDTSEMDLEQSVAAIRKIVEEKISR